ncbi:unnamed protein product [Chrysoparadoxa australica]
MPLRHLPRDSREVSVVSTSDSFKDGDSVKGGNVLAETALAFAEEHASTESMIRMDDGDLEALGLELEPGCSQYDPKQRRKEAAPSPGYVVGGLADSSSGGSSPSATEAAPESFGLGEPFMARPPKIPPKHETSSNNMKIRRINFTEMHNGGVGEDSARAFLGDNPSVHEGMMFLVTGHASPGLSSGERGGLFSSPVVKPLLPLLLPLKKHQDFKMPRHWILPSILAECSPRHFKDTLLWGESCNFDCSTRAEVDWFQAYQLAPAFLSREGNQGMAGLGGSPCGARLLVLQQNYLFEYPNEEDPSQRRERPLGFLCLHNAVVSYVPGSCIIKLEARASSADGEEETLHIAIATADPDTAISWAGLLRVVATLSVESLFDFDRSKTLGKGRFTTVMRGRRKRCRQLGSLCALKVVDKDAFFARVDAGNERSDTLCREIFAQAFLTTKQKDIDSVKPRIVRLLSVFETHKHVVLEMELMSGVDLFDKLSRGGCLSSEDAGALVCNVLKAVDFCISNGFAHRDIKLSNLIYPELATRPCDVRLADFGMAARAGSDGLLRGRCGTPGYVAPEILEATPNEGYSNYVDAFSVGVVAYTVLCGYEPFYGLNERELIRSNKEGFFEFHSPEWDEIDEDAKDMIAKLMEKNPEKRLTVAEALNHPWISRHCSN